MSTGESDAMTSVEVDAMTVEVGEVTVTIKFDNIDAAKTEDGITSPRWSVSNLSWELKVSQGVAVNTEAKYLSWCLYCHNQESDENCSCICSVEISLVNQVNAAKSKSWCYDQTYNSSCINFIEWSELTDSGNGFIKGGSVIFKVKVKNLTPHYT